MIVGINATDNSAYLAGSRDFMCGSPLLSCGDEVDLFHGTTAYKSKNQASIRPQRIVKSINGAEMGQPVEIEIRIYQP